MQFYLAPFSTYEEWPQVKDSLQSSVHMDLEGSFLPGKDPVGVTLPQLAMTK